MADDRPLMATTPGITRKRFTADPLGSEGELSPGPDESNPFRSPEEREIVEAYREKTKQQQESDTGLYQSLGVALPFATSSTTDDPTAGDDPFAFDDVGGFDLPAMDSVDPTNDKGPQF